MTSTHYPAARLERERTAIVLVDHQVGLLLGVHDQDQEQLRRNVVALAKVAKAYDLPVILTTSAEQGPNGALLTELTHELPGVDVIRRPGEIDAFDNEEFAAAVKATGRDQLVIAGISTDVCVAFAALSGIDLGYQVHAILDASGTWNNLASQAAASRMQAAGITLNSTVGVSAEIQRDWRKPGGGDLAALYASHAIPFYGSLVTYVQQ
jgi:nicotinamidase-related amidase